MRKKKVDRIVLRNQIKCRRIFWILQTVRHNFFCQMVKKQSGIRPCNLNPELREKQIRQNTAINGLEASQSEQKKAVPKQIEADCSEQDQMGYPIR